MGQQIRGTFFYQTAFHQLSQSGLQESRNTVLPIKKKSALKALRKTYTLKHCIVDPEDRAPNFLLSGGAESSTDRPYEAIFTIFFNIAHARIWSFLDLKRH